MALLQLLLLAIVPVALVLQLITPLVLNVPCIAIALIALVVAIWGFKRARRNKKVPLFSGLNLVIQTALFLLSILILTVVTIPHESPEDSPAVVQGIRQFLIARGLIEKPKRAVAPSPLEAETKKIPETVNAPDAAKVEIKIEDENKP